LHFYCADDPNDYKQWLRINIGEMHYRLKEKEKFVETLEFLSELVQHENDPKVLEIHASTSISAPSGCYHLVLEYKEICQSRLAAFNENDCVIDAVDE